MERSRARVLRRAATRGLSLVELMAVVVIIGIVALVAVVSYRKIVTSSKVAEATGMVEAIRAAQERYKAETGHYADVSASLSQLYPATTPGNFKTAWGGSCALCKTGWNTLAIKPDAPVMFGYATVADGAACDPACKGVAVSINGTAVDFSVRNGATIAKPWFVVVAKGDTDGNGIFSTVMSDSFSNEVLIDKDSE